MFLTACGSGNNPCSTFVLVTSDHTLCIACTAYVLTSNSVLHIDTLSLARFAGSRQSVTCRAEQQARMGHKRVLLLAHGKKAETPEFKEAYAWLQKDGHDIDLIKTGSPEDMSKGVKKLVSHFGGEHFQRRHLWSLMTSITYQAGVQHAQYHSCHLFKPCILQHRLSCCTEHPDAPVCPLLFVGMIIHSTSCIWLREAAASSRRPQSVHVMSCYLHQQNHHISTVTSLQTTRWYARIVASTGLAR